jgi:hypothetical protein
MKHLVFGVAIALALGTMPSQGIAAYSDSQTQTRSSETVSHGGGCRKSSPPGQCCHMDNSTGLFTVIRAMS